MKIKLSVNCPNCGVEIVRDVDVDGIIYLSDFEGTWKCDGCGDETLLDIGWHIWAMEV